MRAKITIALLALILAVGSCLAAYQYTITDPLTSIDTYMWTNVGPLTGTSIGVVNHAGGRSGALISKTWGSSPDYEVKFSLTLGAGAGSYAGMYAALLRSTQSLSNYYTVEIDPAFNLAGVCTATMYIEKNGSPLASTTVGCHDGMTVRAIIRGTTIRALVDDVEYLSVTNSSITSGKPGVFLSYTTPANCALGPVWIGAIDTTAPSVPATGQAATLVLPNRIDAQWPASPDNANGIGVEYYKLTRNGSAWFNVRSPEFSDQAVSPSTTYTYGISACDFHGNCSTAATLPVTSAPPGAVDPRRVGIRADGTYWGGGGEQIDTRSGNLNFSISLLKAVGRTGWSVPFGLSYNSQLWRQDGTTTWDLGRDVGWGYGWRLQAGSITPYWSDYFTVHHYTYTDATGAEHILGVNTNGIWTSTETGVYVEYDAAAKRLYFPDGSFWYMGAVSSGLEEDGGAMYPTVIEDTNGYRLCSAQHNLTYAQQRFMRRNEVSPPHFGLLSKISCT